MSTATVPPAVTTTTPATDVKTFRGESLEELLPQIREELGPDAVILRQRDGLTGGVAGFFQKRCVEIDARAGTKRIDTYAGADEAQARAALDAGDPRDEDGVAFPDQLVRPGGRLRCHRTGHRHQRPGQLVGPPCRRGGAAAPRGLHDQRPAAESGDQPC